MLVPLYGFVEGDTIGVLVLADDAMSLATVRDQLHASASVRVTIDKSSCQLVIGGKAVEALDVTVEAAGLTALSRIDLRRRTKGNGAP